METAKTKVSKGKDVAFEQFDLKGDSVGETAFSKKLMENKAPLGQTAQYVRVFLNNQRQGNAKAKGRAEVAGTTKKVYKQKGTGKARHGSMRAPIFKGGGVVGGPLPKDYAKSFNKKQRRQVFLTALSGRISGGSVMGLTVDVKAAPKTKAVAGFLKKMKMDGEQILFVLPKEGMDKFVLSIRNIKKASFAASTGVNAYEVLSAKKIVFVNNAFAELEKHFTA